MRTKLVTLHFCCISLLLFLCLNGCDLDSRESANIAKSTFEGILSGDASVAKNFDWKVFQLNGAEFGQQYMTLSNDHERIQFQNAILMRLSQAFKAKNWSHLTMKNWKVDSKGVESATVSCLSQNQGKITIYMQKVNLDKKIRRIDY